MQKDENKTVTPPAWPLNFLEWFCPANLHEGIAGDLIEKFETEVTTIGLKRARRNFFFAVMQFFRPSIILRNKISTNLINTIMLRSHLRSAFRNAWNNKITSLVNILGFGLGMVCVLIIAMVIRYELSFDSFHSGAERIFRIVRVSQVEGQTEYRTGVPYALPDAVKEQIPSLKKVTAMSYHRNAQINVLGDDGATLEKFQEGDGCAFVDGSFFEIFDFKGTGFKWLAGDKKSALTNPYTVVLTRSLAEKYFQSTNVVGRTLRLEKLLDLKVTGVVEDLPVNTDFPFKLLVSYATIRKVEGNNAMNNWSSVSDVNQCYIVLSKGVSTDDIERQIVQLHATKVSKQLSETRSYLLQPLNEVHNDSRFGNYNLRVVTSESIWALAVVGCFLLVMVCINFINLSTALAITRSKEVGIRKVLGSTRSQVVGLSLTETILTIIVALVIAMSAGTFILERIGALTGFEMSVTLYADSFAWIFLFSLAIVITFFAGLYPALALSNFKPALAIKKNLNSRLRGGFQLRSILLVTQFFIMQVLIIATFITVRQMHFFKNVNMGFSKEAIINVEVPETGKDKLATFRNDLQSFSSIGKVSFSSSLPSGLRRARWFRDMRRKGADQQENLVYEYQSVDHHYLELYDIKLLAGRNFTEADGDDNIIINQTLSAKLGFANPDAAINNQVEAMERSVTIIGVTQDFYTNSFKEDYDKVSLTVAPRGYRLASIKLNAQEMASFDNLAESLAYIKQKWNQHFPESVFTYSFLDENVEAFYKEEARLSKLFQLFSMVFLIIGCLGLYGLVSFLAHRKSKEVAMRKVLGASIKQILLLFSKEYVRQIILAFIIAAPVAYYFMSEWLNGFAHHIELQWWYFVIPGIFVLIMALLSVGGQTWKSATANPTESLRSE